MLLLGHSWIHSISFLFLFLVFKVYVFLASKPIYDYKICYYLFTGFSSLQVLSDSIIMKILANLKNLLVLALCHCLGDISIVSFKFSIPNLRKLTLERVTPWMTNNDLVILTRSCANLVELSLLGCTLLSSGQEFSFQRDCLNVPYVG